MSNIKEPQNSQDSQDAQSNAGPSRSSKGSALGMQNLKDHVPGDRQATNMAWEQVIKWEAMHGGGYKCGGIRLISFAKFKTNRSPSAMWAVFWG
jgi:hypothetical protein